VVGERSPGARRRLFIFKSDKEAERQGREETQQAQHKFSFKPGQAESGVPAICLILQQIAILANHRLSESHGCSRGCRLCAIAKAVLRALN
jgi:hypothetical protein